MITLNRKITKNYVNSDIFEKRWNAKDITPMTEKEYKAYYTTAAEYYANVAVRKWLCKVSIDYTKKDNNDYIVVDEDVKFENLKYEEQVKILKEKLVGEKICFLNENYILYEDDDTYYIDDEGLDGVYIFPKTYGLDNALITVRTSGDVRKINFDDYHNIDDIRNSDVIYCLNLEGIKAFLDEISSRNYLSFVYKKEKDKNGYEHYLLSNDNEQFKIYEYGYVDEESYYEFKLTLKRCSLDDLD